MKTLKNLLLIAAVAVLAACNENAPSPVDTQSLDIMMNERISADEPGAAVLVMYGDSVIFEKGYGLADLNTKAPIDANTFFNIASMSKKFTAVAIMQLVEQGKLSLDDAVSKYYPEYMSSMWGKIKIHHLLSHGSGVPDKRGYIPLEERIMGEDSLAMRYLSELDTLNFEPGQGYEYMNPTYVMLGDIVTRVTGQDFTQYACENIFRPSGMEKTMYYFPNCDSIIPNASHGYELDSAGVYKECDYGEETFFATRPDGGVYTSVAEYSNWMREQTKMRAGLSKVLSSESLALAQTAKNHIEDNPAYIDYCYGWIVESKDGQPWVVYHFGGNGGYRTWGAYYPQKNVYVMVFANRADFNTQLFKDQFEKLLK